MRIFKINAGGPSAEKAWNMQLYKVVDFILVAVERNVQQERIFTACIFKHDLYADLHCTIKQINRWLIRKTVFWYYDQAYVTKKIRSSEDNMFLLLMINPICLFFF